MTERLPLPPDDEADMMAAEYVLGVQDMTERTATAARIRSDAVFAARVAAWEARLAPLNAEYAELPAPDVLPRVEARLFPAAPRPRRRLSWGFFGGMATAALLALAVFLSQPLPQTGPILSARLEAEAQALAFAARLDAGTGMLTLTRVAGAPPEAGQDLQLWAIGADGVPVSLGLIREAEVTRPAEGLASGVVLAVSLEPEGGSTTGLPTGPVLVTGVLSEG